MHSRRELHPITLDVQLVRISVVQGVALLECLAFPSHFLASFRRRQRLITACATD